ncbi:MAG TPA: ABC transporter substrate-binding protein [Solirubrobacteraceae bacterium]|jgi:peptide/nickel transport system substrate-binding protein|nr:ABC transporter substrate-binding protein [Solirubrobacteraceae bacterium]
MRKYLSAGMAVVLMVVVVAGCGGTSGQSTGSKSASSAQYPELRVGMAAFPGTINYTVNPWDIEVSVESLAVQGLVEVGPHFELRPLLASSIEHPNATTYIYNIRSGVRFSNGKPLTAEDVAFSLQQNKITKEGQWTAFYADVASIAAHGEAVVVHLKKPDAIWPVVLAASDQIVEKDQVMKVGERMLGTPHALPIGTGPWKLDSYTPEVGVQLSRNPFWRGPRQPARKISVTLFKTEAAMELAMRSGGIDAAFYFESQHAFAAIPNAHLQAGPEGMEDFLSVNVASPPFNDVHVRRAIAYSVDTHGIAKALFSGGAAPGGPTIVSPTAFSGFSSSQVKAMLASLPKYSFDLAAAKRELAKSAYPHGFSTEVMAATSEPLLVTAAQIIAADLAKIGIVAKVRPITPAEYSDLYGKKIKILLTETTPEFADPDGVLPLLVSAAFIRPPGNGVNVAEYSNPEVEKLLVEEQGEAASSTRRLQMLAKIFKIVGTEAPYLQVITHGLFMSLSNEYINKEWSINTALYSPWAMNIHLAH